MPCLPYKDVINALPRGLCFEFTNRVVSKHVMLMSIHIHIPPNNRVPIQQQQQRELTLCRIRNRNFLKNKTKYTIRNKIFALACHQRRGLVGNGMGMGAGMRLQGTLVYAWDPLTTVINQFPIMQLSETRVSNKNTRVHRIPLLRIFSTGFVSSSLVPMISENQTWHCHR